MKSESPEIVFAEPQPIGVGSSLIVVLTFDVKGPARQNIEAIMSRGNLNDNMIILTDGRISVSQYTFMSEMAGTGWLLARGDLAKRMFMIQWDALCRRYEWDPLTDYVPQISSNHVNGYMVPHSTGTDPIMRRMQPHEAVDDWSWIVKNCQGKAWWHESFWLFESDADAVMFKLSRTNE